MLILLKAISYSDSIWLFSLFLARCPSFLVIQVRSLQDRQRVHSGTPVITLATGSELSRKQIPYTAMRSIPVGGLRLDIFFARLVKKKVNSPIFHSFFSGFFY